MELCTEPRSQCRTNLPWLTPKKLEAAIQKPIKSSNPVIEQRQLRFLVAFFEQIPSYWTGIMYHITSFRLFRSPTFVCISL